MSCLPNQCALRTWLANKLDIPIAHGPGHEQSPHAYDKEVDYEPVFKGLAMQAACTAPCESTTATPTKEQLLALRMVAYGLSTDHQRRPRHIVALGFTKAMHELLTLHYFAIDSAAGWDDLMLKRLPGASLLKADARRQIALDMFEKSHITPSYRRLPHPSWTMCFRLLIDLLIGAGKTRYLGTRPHARHQREVFVRGFSEGSYSGICLLHLLWEFPFVDARGKLGGIACPPELLSAIPADKGRGLQLFHYERDLLCCWQAKL